LADNLYKLSVHHPIYGYYHFDMRIENDDDSYSMITLKRQAGRSFFFDPMKLADRFIIQVEVELQKYGY